MNTDNDPAVRMLAELHAAFAEEQRQYSVRCYVDALERVHTSQTKLISALMAGAREETLRDIRTHRLKLDKGGYYQWIDDAEAQSRMHPDSWRESYETLKECSDELGLSDLPLFIKWFRPAFNARERYLAGDSILFSNTPGIGGEVAWNKALSTGQIAINADLELITAKIVAHELFHIHQMRTSLLDEAPTGSLLNELEREAEAYADQAYCRVRLRRFPLHDPE